VPERAKNETLRFGGAVASRAFRKDERDGHETDDVAETQLWPEPGPKLEGECRENAADIAGAMTFSACLQARACSQAGAEMLGGSLLPGESWPVFIPRLCLTAETGKKFRCRR
jgi:hypothetical protein